MTWSRTVGIKAQFLNEDNAKYIDIDRLRRKSKDANINRVVEDDKDKNKGVIRKVSEMVSSTT